MRSPDSSALYVGDGVGCGEFYCFARLRAWYTGQESSSTEHSDTPSNALVFISVHIRCELYFSLFPYRNCYSERKTLSAKRQSILCVTPEAAAMADGSTALVRRAYPTSPRMTRTPNLKPIATLTFAAARLRAYFHRTNACLGDTAESSTAGSDVPRAFFGVMTSSICTIPAACSALCRVTAARAEGSGHSVGIGYFVGTQAKWNMFRCSIGAPLL